MPEEIRRMKWGLIEFQTGAGPVDLKEQTSGNFASITTLAGYQLDKNFLIALGTGFSVHRGLSIVPLFLDFRYAIASGFIEPYLFAEGGLMLNPADINKTKIFINPGIGAQHFLSQRFALLFSSGFRLQKGDLKVNPFLSFSTGIKYKF